MVITREELIKRLSAQSGYFQKDIRTLLQCMDDVVFNALCEATLDEDVQIQMVTGIKLGCKKIDKRSRVDPRTQEPIGVDESPKPFVKFSQDFRFKLDAAYEKRES